MINFINSKKTILNYGPYSSSVKTKHFLITSGQIPINKNITKIPKKISDQTIIALQNIRDILIEEKLDLCNIIKTTIFTTKLKKIEEINLSYKNFFQKYTNNFPARSCIGVFELPKNSCIEIEAIAYF